MIAPLMFVVQTYVIRKEEQYLQRAFGEEFIRYKSKVRRWL
jgi:protein-S-isoprenylcysteine O-methyltransferase Ste14